ncbi:MAG: hypothetical protein WBB19_18070 [Desulforhopalus sp.]
MDTDILILLMMIFAVFCWWFKQQLDENRKFSRELEKEKKERLARAERVRQLTNRR